MKRSSFLRCRGVTMLVTLLVFLMPLALEAQSQTGNIYGKVIAKDGSVMPGVTVTLTGVAAPQIFVTDKDGDFRFPNLSPGTYALKAELSGLGTAIRKGVDVNVGRNSDVTLTLNPALSEIITVTSEAPLLDVRKESATINVTRAELEKIPTSRDPWTILQQAPGVQVDRLNIGGNQSGQQSNYVGKGSAVAQNTWNVDGVNITDEGATGASPTYYDFDAFEEMQVSTGGSDPRIQTPGVQLNMLTKRGTNDFIGSSRYFYTPGSYQADATVPAEAQSYLALTNKILYVRDQGIEAGGPVWKDHLWLWGAYSQNKISNLGATPPDTVVFPDNIVLKNKNAKLNGQFTPSNSGVAFYDFGDKDRNARGQSPTRPPETTWTQVGPAAIYKIEDTQLFSPTLFVTGLASKVSGGFSLTPHGGLGPNAPNTYRDVNNVYHNNQSFYSTDRPQNQYRADGSKFIDIGRMNNELKFGFGYRSTPVSSQSGFPGSSQGYWRFRSDSFCTARGLPVGCGQAKLFRDSNKDMEEKSNDLYVGDTVLVGNLTVQGGLRYDLQKSRNTATTVAANPVIPTPITLPGGTASLPASTFAGDAKSLQWKSIVPRLGLTYAVGADKKTLVRAGYNRYVNQIGSTVLSANPFGPYYSYFVFLGNDLNGDKIIQRNELAKLQSFYYINPDNPSSIPAPTRLDYNMKPPKTDELVVGLEHELLPDLTIGVNASYRKYTDILETRNEKTQGLGDVYTSADYHVAGNATGTLPNGKAYSVPYYLLNAGVPIPAFAVIRNRPDYYQTYNGFELVATKRLSNRWMMRGNVSLNNWNQHAGPASFGDPTPRLINGVNGCLGACNGQVFERSAGSGSFKDVFIQSKWTYNLTGLYQLPLDFSLGASLTGRQGYPKIYRDEISTDNGVDDVVLEGVGSNRFANVNNLDLRAAKDFKIKGGVGITFAADLFNVMNRRTVLQRETLIANDSSPAVNADQITELQSPRVWRFSARLSF